MFDGLKVLAVACLAGAFVGAGLALSLPAPQRQVSIRPMPANIDAGVADAVHVGSTVLVREAGELLIAGEIKQISTTNIDRRPLRATQDYLARLQLEDGRERWVRLGSIEAAVSSHKRPRIPGPDRFPGDLGSDVGARGAKK